MVQKKLKVAAMVLVLTGLALSPLRAAPSEYKITVDVMGPDGSKRLSGTFTCSTYERCQNVVPLVVDGKPFKMGVRSYLLVDHHIRVMLQGNDLLGGPFSDTESDRPFEAGQAWDEQLVKWVWGSKTPKVFGQAHIRVFKTASGGAYSFQLHVGDQKEALANAAVIAPAGSGKTTFFEHLIGGALRHDKLRAYIFDRFNGTRIFTEATGGAYIDLADGKTQLNPLQVDDTKENRQFLNQFLMQLAGVDDDDSREVVNRGVDAIFGVPRMQRSLNSVLQTGFDTESAVKKGLLKWTGDSPYAGWFNGERDSLDVEGARLVAFEMTEVQKEPALAAAMVTYIMHRIRQIVRAQALPHLIFIDETAPMLEDPVFRLYVETLFREHRKLRGSVNVCFQDAGALLRSPITGQGHDGGARRTLPAARRL